MGAVVATHLAGAAMDDQARRASPALGLPAARRAEQRRSESPAIDEDETLLAAAQTLGDLVAQRRTQPVMAVGRAVGHQGHGGQAACRPRAARERKRAIAAAPRRGVGFERRRRATQYDGDSAQPGAIDRDIACVVTHAVLLLERYVVLFVDHDQAESRHRGEDCEPRSDDEVRLSPRRGKPVLQPLPVGEPAVQGRASRAREGGRDALLELRSQADFGDEYQRLSPGGDDPLGRREVDLGLAAAGHALEERRREPISLGEQGLERGPLVCIERSRTRLTVASGGVFRRRVARPAPSRGQWGQHLREALAERLLVVVGHEPCECAQVRREGRQLSRDFVDRRDALGRNFARATKLDRDAEDASPTEARAQDRTRDDLQPRRQPIVENPVDVDRQRDADDSHLYRAPRSIRATSCSVPNHVGHHELYSPSLSFYRNSPRKAPNAVDKFVRKWAFLTIGTPVACGRSCGRLRVMQKYYKTFINLRQYLRRRAFSPWAGRPPAPLCISRRPRSTFSFFVKPPRSQYPCGSRPVFPLRREFFGIRCGRTSPAPKRVPAAFPGRHRGRD